jgi:outer membrane protein
MKKLLLTALVLLSGFGVAQAQKFGYVDSKMILEQMPEYQSAMKEVADASAKWQAELEKMYQDIEKMYEAYRAEEVLLPEDQRQSRQEEIYEKEREAKEFKKNKFGYEGELYKFQDEKIRPLQEQVYLAIEATAKEKKLDFILDKSSGSQILYSNPLFDRTEDVIKKLGVAK